MESNNMMVDYNDDSLYEAIDLHNEHVDKMLDLGYILFNMFDKNDPVIDAFREVFNSAAGMSIYLCCEANSRERKPAWSVAENLYVIDE